MNNLRGSDPITSDVQPNQHRLGDGGRSGAGSPGAAGQHPHEPPKRLVDGRRFCSLPAGDGDAARWKWMRTIPRIRLCILGHHLEQLADGAGHLHRVPEHFAFRTVGAQTAGDPQNRLVGWAGPRPANCRAVSRRPGARPRGSTLCDMRARWLFLVPPAACRRRSSRRSLTADSAIHPQEEKIVEEVSAGRIRAIIERLVSFGTRNTMSSQDDPERGIGAARKWIFDQFQS